MKPALSTKAQMDQKVLDLLPKDAIAFGPVGSRLHGLETKDSDYDYLVIVTGKDKRPQRFLDEFDLQFVSLSSLLERAQFRPSFTETCLLSSGKMIVVDPSFAPILSSIRIGYLSAYNVLSRFTEFTQERLEKHLDRNEVDKAYKSLRVIIRNEILLEKLLVEPTFSPVFTPEEKVTYRQRLLRESEELGLV